MIGNIAIGIIALLFTLALTAGVFVTLYAGVVCASNSVKTTGDPP